MAWLRSVNVGAASPTEHSAIPVTGIDKRPVPGPVEVRAPGPRGVGGSGLVGDAVCDLRDHGGDDQAVYAYAREDLDRWEVGLARRLPCGVFGENLTTEGLDVTAALIGEHWQVGPSLLLEVSMPRIPCRTFAGWLAIQGWVVTFTRRGAPGTYLRVLSPGPVRPGDPIRVVHRPDHFVTVGLSFRALTDSPDLLPRLRVAAALPEAAKERVRRRSPQFDDA
ncbi:MAG TPA: MOSC domain-containing protein [Mycobacteriales bacterium]|nr:MOSC domain-containing protein [Mycobacteriales bacterium]